MEEQEQVRKEKKPNAFMRFCLRHSLKPATVIAALVIVLVLGVGVITLGARTRISSRATQLGLRNIGELATQEANVTSVQTIEKARAMFGLTIPGTTTKRIFSYDCRIKAGLDFGEIELSENAETKTVTVTLPQVKVFSNEINPDSMQLYDERKSMFAQLNVDDMNTSLVKMREEVEKNAIANGLLENARSNAETLIRAFLASVYNPEEWKIEFVSAEG